MSIFDFLKRKKEKVKPSVPVEVEKKKKLEKRAEVRTKKEKKEKEKKQKVKREVKKSKVRRIKRSRYQNAYRVLKEPHLTEKASILNENKQYVFKVFPKANKIEVKKAIEKIYGVDVESVNILRVPRKRRRLGRITGWRKGYKKAIVKIKKGQTIEILSK